MSDIHPSAIIEDGAQIAPGVRIGPYCMVGGNVTLAKDVHLIGHVCVSGHTSIGEGTEIFPFASIGHRPQDKKFKGEASRLTIGKRNIIREHVTMNPGTESGGMLTQIGDDCLFMASAHVAHDCILGNGIIMANNATLAGHVTVEDGVTIGGLSAVHQFVRLGAYAFVGGMCGVAKDLIPYGMMIGGGGGLSGLNLVGLKRRGISRESIAELRETFQRLFFGEGTLSERASRLKAQSLSAESTRMVDFILSDSSRSFTTPAADIREVA